MALGHSCIDEEVAVITRNWPYLDWSTILGYIVATNKSVVITHSTDHYSRFATSRPDLYMYSPNHHCGFIVTEQGLSQKKKITQGVTENTCINLVWMKRQCSVECVITTELGGKVDQGVRSCLVY